ncbi:MAG: hypothetical protein LUG24_02630 [Clostridiales bacterium]|nr:hypothetical protein [Clostridiales bacterium]
MEFSVVFNSDIEAGSGKMYLKDYSTDEVLLTFTYDGINNYFWAADNTLYITADESFERCKRKT